MLTVFRLQLELLVMSVDDCCQTGWKLLAMSVDDDCCQTAWKLRLMSVDNDCCQTACHEN